MSKAWWSEESVEMAQKQKSVSRGEDYIYQGCRAAVQTETGSEKDNSQKAGLARKERESGGNLNNKRINVWNRTKGKKKKKFLIISVVFWNMKLLIMSTMIP